MADPVENERAPVIEPGYTLGSVTDKISSIVLTRPTSNGWFVGFGVAFLLLMMMLFAISYLFVKGVGIWGVTIPIGWGFAIVNFVWWIGIGHAGTLISAILLLLRQSWRNSINRFAEAMTLFAVAGVLALSLSQHHACVATIPQPAGLGCIRGLDLCHHLGAVLVHRADSRSRDFARPLRRSLEEDHLRNAGHGLARLGPALASLRDRVPAARRTGHAAGALRPHRGQFRFCRGHRTRLAYHHLSALLRRRCDLLRLCHGADAGHP